MDAKRALQWSGYYFLLTAVSAAVGLAFVLAGVVIGIEPAVDAYRAGESITSALQTGAVGLVVALFGVCVWRLGKAWAFYRTFSAAIGEELGESLDTEHVKSDILSVLDDRLAEMQRDINAGGGAAGKPASGDAGADFEFED